MAQTRFLTIQHPTAGVLRHTAFQKQPPFSLYDARDCWLYDAKSGQERLSVRPGYASFASPSGTVNLQATLAVAVDQTYAVLPMCAAQGTIYRWNGTGWLSVGSGVSTGRNVMAASYGSKLYVANDSTPKVYDHDTLSFGDVSASAGTFPSGNRIVCQWDDRLVWAGDPTAPHVVSMSRQGDPDDYDYGADPDDVGGAVQSTSAPSGHVNFPVTAVIPHNRECLAVAGRSELTIFRQNPRSPAGEHEWLHHSIGIVCPTAWCKTADDWTYMLSRDGLYRMPPGCGVPPQSVSRERIPNELLAVDGVSNVAYLEYDVRFRQIHIHVTNLAEETDYSWHFDVAREAFMPQTVAGTAVLSLHRHDLFETVDASGVLVGTNSGLKRLDRNTALGSATAYAFFGPLKIGGQLGYQALIEEAVASFSGNTTDATGTVTFYCARDGERVVAPPTDRSYQIEIGKCGAQRSVYPRIAGHAAGIKIAQGSGSAYWSLEELGLRISQAGKERW